MDDIITTAFVDELNLIKAAGAAKTVWEGAKKAVGAGAGGVGKVWGAANAAAEAAAQHLEGAGTSQLGRAAAGLARLAPASGLAYGGYKAYESGPVQNLRAKWQLHQAQQMYNQGNY